MRAASLSETWAPGSIDIRPSGALVGLFNVATVAKQLMLAPIPAWSHHHLSKSTPTAPTSDRHDDDGELPAISTR